jgi:capsular polysaccharide biosynthesis protein
MDEYEKEIELIDYLNVIWKRKWLIIIPTFFLVVVVGVISFLLPKKWEIDAIIVPSKFLIQTEQGAFNEIVVVDPKQIASQINEATYNTLIAAELNLDIREFPKLKADNIRDTKLVRVTIKEEDVEKAKRILYSLFTHLKRDLDKKIDVEIKGIDTEISTNENLIKKSKIEKNKIRQEIISAENKLKISGARVISIMEEMKAVKQRIDGLEEQQRKTLSEKKQVIDAISLLLYSNEVQLNLRYYNTLDEKLSDEKITQEDLKLNIEEKKTEIEKINNEIENINNQIDLLAEKKSRIDYAQFIKEPTSSLYPVSPKKKLNVLVAGILGLMIFTMLSFFLEYLEKQRIKSKE